MGFQILLGTVNKRVNSTLQPDTTGWTTVEAVWKKAKDIDSPTVEIFLPSASVYPEYNYMYIPSVASYYWITGIRSVRADVWEFSAEMDILATYKTAIMGTTCFIEYGFNQDTSGSQFRLTDTRQAIGKVPSIYTESADITGGLINTSTGCYVLTAVGASGGVTAYVIAASSMNTLLDNIGTDIQDELDAYDTIEDLFKVFARFNLSQGNAISAIRSCNWLPVSASAFDDMGSVQPVYLGDFDSGVAGVAISSNLILKRETNISIPWPASDWKRMLCQILVYVPFVGTVAVPIDQCNNASSLHFTWCLEPIGGTVSLRIDAGSYTVYTGSASIAASYAIGVSNIPASNYITGTVSLAAGGIQVGGGIASVLAGVASPVADVAGTTQVAGAISSMSISGGIQKMVSGYMQAYTPVVQCTGSLSGSAACGQSMDAEICLLYYPPVDDAAFQAVYGFPVMKMATPVPGYCQTRGFSMAAPARGTELNAIANCMNNGVFIE